MCVSLYRVSVCVALFLTSQIFPFTFSISSPFPINLLLKFRLV